MRRFLSRLLNVVWPGRQEAGLAREVEAHLALLEDEYRRRGSSPSDARRYARLALGGVDRTKELHREARSFRCVDEARRDIGYALRMLRRHPVAALTAGMSLAIGIGLNAAIFSVVDWVLLRPLPYPAAHELVRLFTAGTSPVTKPGSFTADEFRALGGASSLRRAAGFSAATRVMSGAGMESCHVVIARVAGDLFGTLGIDPHTGRAFTREELAGGAPVVVLGHALWQRRFASDPAIAGRTVQIDGRPYTIVGVMPAGRAYPAGVEAWRPATIREFADGDRDFEVIARVRSGVSVARTSVEIATLVRTATKGARTAWGDEMQRAGVAGVDTALKALLGAALLTLLIVCANVAALVGARSADRTREIAIRGSLGATRGRVLAQLLAENMVLALAGGGCGLLLGHWTLRLLVAVAPLSIPRLSEIALDGRIVGLGLVATLLTGVAVGLAPALRLSRLTGSAGPERLGSSRMTARSNGRRALVLLQIATAVVLTAGAGLLVRSLQRLVATNHGFAADRLVSADLSLRGIFDGDSRRLFGQLVEHTASLPGVASVAVSLQLPTQVIGVRSSVQFYGEAASAASAVWRPVSPAYFETVGIPILAGRPLSRDDAPRAPRVAVVNNAFVRQFLGGREPIGARFTGSIYRDLITIVGVAGDVTPAGEADRPAVYVTVDQFPIGGGYLLVRAKDDPRALIGALAARLHATAPNLAMDRVRRVAEALEAGRAVTRFTTQVTACFAGLALLLSMIGVYGLAASEVAARWRELAVRMALGASHGAVIWTVLRPCAMILAAGVAIGVLGARSAGPALASLLHGVSARDLPSLVFAPALLSLVGVAGALLAVLRVLRADAAATLRNE